MLNYIPLVSKLEELLLVLSRSLVVADTAARQLDSFLLVFAHAHLLTYS